jgi:outer membrane protein assembly factor BamB
MSNETIKIGIGGHVVSIDPATGVELWRTKLKGSDFVTVYDAGQYVYGGTSGVLFCLEASTGRMLWKNELKGLGTGLITFVSSDGAAGAAVVTKRRQAAAATVVVASGS